jgi:hypothetical protein
VGTQLAEATAPVQRALIRALVKRVEVDQDQVRVVVRIGPGPPSERSLQYCLNLPERGTRNQDESFRVPRSALPLRQGPGETAGFPRILSYNKGAWFREVVRSRTPLAGFDRAGKIDLHFPRAAARLDRIRWL